MVSPSCRAGRREGVPASLQPARREGGREGASSGEPLAVLCCERGSGALPFEKARGLDAMRGHPTVRARVCQGRGSAGRGPFCSGPKWRGRGARGREGKRGEEGPAYSRAILRCVLGAEAGRLISVFASHGHRTPPDCTSQRPDHKAALPLWAHTHPRARARTRMARCGRGCRWKSFPPSKD